MGPVIILIPALNPLQTIVQFVEKLQKLRVEQIIIVNDGSDAKYDATFETLRQLENCVVLHHEGNFGKGRALKTGFDYISKMDWQAKGIVTVGAHGQHSILDVEQIIASTKVFSDGFILGIRNFTSGELPMLSFVSNRAASMLFELLFHKRLLDTQTGLRYLPKSELGWLKKVPGESYSYDINMLVATIKRKVPIYEVPIGEAKLKKNSVIYYDEVFSPAEIFHQIWVSFIKNK
mgnify:CR=1 FL=1